MKIILIAQIIAITFFLQPHFVHAANSESTELKGGHQIEVISLNLDKDVNMAGSGEMDDHYFKFFPHPLPLKDMIRESLAEGKKWDIIGFQELIEGHRGDVYDSALFIQMMKELKPERTYRCVTQKINSDGFAAGVCSHYPFIENTFREEIIFTSSNKVQNRVIVCVQIDTPAGIIPVCSTHPRAGSDPPSQFRNMENIVFERILPSYVPATIPPDLRTPYINSLKARLVLTGDMNYTPNGTEKFQSTCIRKWPGIKMTEQMGGCGIDQVMIVKMNDPFFAHTEPFNRYYLTPIGGYLDHTKAWPTDHMGPVFSLIQTAELAPLALKQGDLDNDGDVDVFDYNILLGKFGATGAPGFHAADIVQNGAVDIFDYNKLVENFGK